MLIQVEKADYLADYKIFFNFSDGVKRIVDFEYFLQSSKNPMTRKFLDKGEFANFRIEFGDVIWDDYVMCFPIWDLHEGKI